MPAELQQAVEDEAGAHAVADEGDGALAVAAAHEDVREQDARLLRPVERHRPCMVYHLRVKEASASMPAAEVLRTVKAAQCAPVRLL